MKFQRSVISSLLIGSALALASCASGPSYAEAIKTLPPIPKGKGRVFVYRDSSFGAAVRPKIKIDDQPVGTSVAKGFVYSDQAPGQHVVSLATEWKHKDTFSVTAGEPSFVRSHITIGAFVGHVIPTAVSKAEGESEIQNCKLVTE
ncbi:MAG: DUF2846 domain-containing protein [Verrucomicrobiota bacterium]